MRISHMYKVWITLAILMLLTACNVEEYGTQDRQLDDAGPHTYRQKSLSTTTPSKNQPHGTEKHVREAQNALNELLKNPQFQQPQPGQQQRVVVQPPINQPQQTPVQQPEQAPAPQPEQAPAPQPEQAPANQQNQGSNQAETTQGISAFESKVIELTNNERKKNGLSALQTHTDLSNVARKKSDDMQANNYFSHTSPTYGSPFDMIRDFGVSYKTAAENIAQGQPTPEEVVNAWMNSEGHRKNILNGSFTHIGVGHTENGHYWTQMFIGQ